MTNKRLTPKQAAFVDEYMIDLNATAAARRAGYKDPNIGRQLITKNNVAEAIRKRKQDLALRNQIEQDQIIQELVRLAFSNMTDFVSWGPNSVVLKESDEISGGQAACVSEVVETVSKYGKTVRIKLHSKEKALELLGRHLGMWDETKDHEEKLTVIFEQHIGTMP